MLLILLDLAHICAGAGV